MAEMRAQRGLDFAIEVDGGITMENVADVVRAGVTRIVAGSSIFHTPDPSQATRLMRERAEQALHRLNAVFFVEMDDHLSVRLRGEAVPLGF